MDRHSPVAGKNVLVTGAGGFIGTALAKELAAGGAQSLVLLDASEQNLFTLMRTLRSDFPETRMQFVVGSVLDAALLASLFGASRIGMVFHAAAYKHVELMELNPFAALQNNTVGTFTLIQAALQNGCLYLIVISTDKAVKPHSVMGVSKRIAELLTVSLSFPGCRMNALRLTNVMDSTGSVGPIFRDQIARSVPLTITHPDASRYFITIEQAMAAIRSAAACKTHGKILMPGLPAPVRIADLAHGLLRGRNNYPIAYVGLRAGEKLTEDFLGSNEYLAADLDQSLNVIETSKLTREQCNAAMRQLETCIHERDTRELVEVLTNLVPDYVPSDSMLDLANVAATVQA